MAVYQVRALTVWPGRRTPSSRRSPFAAGWTATLRLLERELRQLAARDVVLEVDVSESQIRLDGELYATARPRSPGVVLSFTSRHGPLRYPCDRFDRWQDNVRAIALALEALRKVDRYGITQRGEQYTGWKRLPAAGATTLTTEAAADRLHRISGLGAEAVLDDVGVYRDALRDAQRATHPDRGGSVERFQEIMAAKQVLDRHHGLVGQEA